ncbi:putative mariner transposase [Trichonephila clavipes]|nr:putative mariner transposase [Trichonephila clavipes]
MGFHWMQSRSILTAIGTLAIYSGSLLMQACLKTEVADDLAKAAASDPVDPEDHMVLTSAETYSRAIELICKIWVVPPMQYRAFKDTLDSPYHSNIPDLIRRHSRDFRLWCKRFSVGRESTEDDQRPGRLVTVSGVETVTKINQIVRADRRMSIRMIVEAVNADKETVR